MKENQYTVLCVDDEPNILNALKRVLRREPYRLITAGSGPEALELLAETPVQVILSDQRMPGMNGIELLAEVKKRHPDVLRIILTGYTEVASITESINKGNIYKFFLKPWSDENIRLEIKAALDQWELMTKNRELSQEIRSRSERPQIRLSQAILEALPYPVVGISEDGTIALANRRARELDQTGDPIQPGRTLGRYFGEDIQSMISTVVRSESPCELKPLAYAGRELAVHVSPLCGEFCGKGAVLTLQPK